MLPIRSEVCGYLNWELSRAVKQDGLGGGHALHADLFRRPIHKLSRHQRHFHRRLLSASALTNLSWS